MEVGGVDKYFFLKKNKTDQKGTVLKGWDFNSDTMGRDVSWEEMFEHRILKK